MDEEWDLYAVVRNVTTTTTTTITTADVDVEATATIDSILASILSPTIVQDQLMITDDDLGILDHDHDHDHDHFLEMIGEGGCGRNPFDELGELYRPFFPAESQPMQMMRTESTGAAEAIQVLKRSLLQQQQELQFQHHHQHQHQQRDYFVQQSHLPAPAPTPPPLPPPQYRCRKRKNDQKRTTCQVTAENILTSDKWAWRKYGQKPIKGSPYPRNYYRCSSMKGCTARKQVERSPTDPTIYVVTYTGDHSHPRPTHRNSLAGSTRSKFSSSSVVSVNNQPLPPSTSDSKAAGVSSPTTPLEKQDVKKGNEDDDDGLLFVFDHEILAAAVSWDPSGEMEVASAAGIESPGKTESG